MPSREHIFLIIVAIIFLLISVYNFTRKKIYTKKVKAIVQSSNCTKDIHLKKYVCNIQIKYNIGKDEFTGSITHYTNFKLRYNPGKVMDAYVEEGNPLNVSGDKDSNTIAYVFLFFSLLLLAFPFLSKEDVSFLSELNKSFLPKSFINKHGKSVITISK
jgi:hypothetical protein